MSALGVGSGFVLGIAASGHCVLMCGGITGALTMATARDTHGRPRRSLLAAYQVGRVFGYGTVGLILGTLGALLYGALDDVRFHLVLRSISAMAFLLCGLALVQRRGVADRMIGARAWRYIAPHARKLLPIATLPHAFGFGFLWGWLPCGLLYTVLLLAWTSFDSFDGAATMIAFGLGTLPAMFGASLAAASLARGLARPPLRRALGVVMLVFALIAIAGPWFASVASGPLARLVPLICAPL